MDWPGASDLWDNNASYSCCMDGEALMAIDPKKIKPGHHIVVRFQVVRTCGSIGFGDASE